MKPIQLLQVCLASLALFTSGCSGAFKALPASRKAAAEFHKLYNEGKAGEIRTAADSAFQNGGSATEWSDVVRGLQKKLGNVTNSSMAGINVRVFNLKTLVTLQQRSLFEHGTGIETFVFKMNGDKAVLLCYNISSKELLMN